VAWLTQEIRDMLDAGPVGLYEFPSFLDDAAQELPWVDQIRIFEAVLENILSSGDAHLTWEVWAKDDLSQDATGVVPDERTWKWPWPSNDQKDLARPYLALTPTASDKGSRWKPTRRRGRKADD
jgi:hypothetical protein